MAGSSALKRKRQHNDDEKLNHTASVQFTREIKKIKTFEIQKVVKTLSKDPQNSKLAASVELLKRLDVAHVARRAMLSLGLDPPETKKAKTSENADADAGDMAALEATFLKHKRLLPLLDTWKAKAAERANKLFREENAILKQARESSKQQHPSGRRGASASESMFLGSLSGLGENSGFEDDIADFLGENHKKNRPGQRARKQKALMEEQRKTGKAPPAAPTLARGGSKYGPSSRAAEARPPRPATTQGKVRPPRPGSTQGSDRRQRHSSASPGDRSAPPRPPPAAQPSRRETAADKTHHPSWAAKQAQKDKEKVSIHAFAGKKVVFDD